MGLPETKIDFEQLAVSIKVRSERGILALLLDDSTKATAITHISREADIVSADWTAGNVDRIKMGLRSGAFKVLAVRMLKNAEGNNDVAATLDSIGMMEWNWACAPGEADPVMLVDWIKAARAEGKPYKAVVGEAATPDCEGIVNLTTKNIVSNFMGTDKTYTPAEYALRVAGLLAGISLSESVTGYVFEDIISAEPHADANAEIDNGDFVIVFNGVSYECGRGVTSLKNAVGVPKLFKKIKHVEGADMISADISKLFKANYKGKRVNSYNNKQSFVAEIINYFKDLCGSVLSPDYDNLAMVDAEAQTDYLREQGVDTDMMTEVQILTANTGELVFIAARIMLIDAMEDLYMRINLM